MLADAGFRAVAPWTRGYAPTDIPDDGDYTVQARPAQLPASKWLVRRDLEPLLALWRRWSPGYVPTDEDRLALQVSLRHPDDMRAALSSSRTLSDSGPSSCRG